MFQKCLSMYLGKAKKQIELQDEKEFEEKRSKLSEKSEKDSSGLTKVSKEETDFKLEELPDGSCFRPKSVVEGSDDGQTAIRPAEYIGSFSVSGENQSSRAEFVQQQLENMHNVEKSKKILLVISLSGVKVCSSNGESVYMAHALKRISYAACDPDFCQFAFLAREPKGHINIQFCHAFVTQTPEEAEELNTIIGNAFKMAYAQQKVRQPTFNELIEQQLVEQKAKYAEYQDQVQKTLQQKLTEIATPTALQRMEMRRQSSSDELSSINSPVAEREFVVGNKKVWAKQAAEKVQHRSPVREMGQGPLRSESPTFSSSRSSASRERISSRLSDPSFSVKRNSTPTSVNSPSKTSVSSSSPKRNSSPHLSSLQNFQVVTIRESLENNLNNSNVNNSNRFKGSPVTALKDEIDRRYFNNGGLGTLDSGLGSGIDDVDSFPRPLKHKYENEEILQSAPHKMVNRPLPAIPTASENLIPDHRASPRLRNWSSLDDDVIPHHTRSTLQVRQRDSPKRRPQRPQSEVFLDHHKMYGASTASPDQPGVYIYGFKSQTDGQISQNINFSPPKSQVPNISPTHLQSMQQAKQHADMRLRHNLSPKGTGYDNMQNLKNGKASPTISFQNGSPSQSSGTSVSDSPESSPAKSKTSGLESLMGLDRSHIEDETLRHSSWYQAGIPRDVALEILQQEDIGSFIVRDSSTHPGCYALSVRVPKFENPTGISHYLILKTQRGVKLKGLDKEWSSLLSLVTHHTVMPEMLPCTLRLPRDTNNPTFKASDKDDREEDPDYQRLADFSSMMEALKM